VAEEKGLEEGSVMSHVRMQSGDVNALLNYKAIVRWLNQTVIAVIA